MTTNGDGRLRLLDTSTSIAFCVESHEAHRRVYAALAGQPMGLAGHAAFETYSVLTRLAPPERLTAAAAESLITTNFPDSRFLTAARAADLLAELAGAGISGGAVYDALVAAVAVEHDVLLVTRDRRAVSTYRAVGARFELLA